MKTEKEYKIPVPTIADGYTKEQIEEWRKGCEEKAAQGKRFVGDY